MAGTDVFLGPTRRSTEGAEGPSTSVTLIRPPVVVMPESLSTHGPVPPIGLAYVAAAVREAGYEVQVIDSPGEAIAQWEPIDTPVGELHRIGLSPEEVVERIDPRSTVVGITNMFQHEWPQVRAIVGLLKERRPEVFVVLGGENPTAFHSWIMDEEPGVDCCVLGEGEQTIIALLARFVAGQPLDDLPGVALNPSMSTTTLPPGLPDRMTKAQLDEAPRPAWDLIPLDQYWAHYPFLGVNRGRSLPILGTRGCPYKCTFCSSPQMWTTKFVMRDPEDVVDEIVTWVETYGVENVNFVDLTAATNKKWIIAVCDALERRAPDLAWQLPIGTRSEQIDEVVLQRLWDTNCRNIAICPETGSERMLEIYDKRVKLPHILETIQAANRIGVHTVMHIIIGHPAETWRDIALSWKFLLKAAITGSSDIAVMMFCPYPGSADYRRMVEAGELVVDERSYYAGLSRSSSAHRSWNASMSSRQLRLVQLGMLCSFYATAMLRRPRRAWEFVRSQFGGSEDTYLDQVIRTRRRNLTPVSSAPDHAVRA